METNSRVDATVFYNGACPVCRAMARQQVREAPGGVTWRDIHLAGEDARLHGICRADVERRLHLVEANGTVWRGYEAMQRLRAFAGRRRTRSRVLAALERMNVEVWSWVLYQFNRLRK